MNESNSITNETRLYGFIAEYAQQNRFSVTLNRLFKADSSNMMMIPMNIREDDFYFTLSNMKQSHVNGAMIGEEYRSAVMELLDEKTDQVEKSGFCDFVIVEDKHLKPLSITPLAIKEKAHSLHVKNIAIIGTTPLAYALALELQDFECAFFDPYIEDLMQMSEVMGIDIDINRMADTMRIDMSTYELLIDASEYEDFSMITTLPLHVMALHINKKSNLKTLSSTQKCQFIDYEMMLEYLTDTTYKILTQEKKSEK
jgi:shikimate 5-dehydrogenase